MGRPTKNPRTEKIGIRISKEELQMLNTCSEILETTRANVIIDGIKRTFEELPKNK